MRKPSTRTIFSRRRFMIAAGAAAVLASADSRGADLRYHWRLSTQTERSRRLACQLEETGREPLQWVATDPLDAAVLGVVRRAINGRGFLRRPRCRRLINHCHKQQNSQPRLAGA